MTCIDRSVMICIEATTEVEALRKALAEAEGKAVKEQAARKKLKARVNEVQQELQDAVRKGAPHTRALFCRCPRGARIVATQCS